MPGYSFQPQFVEPICAGTKGGTIRAARRIPQTVRPGGHARPGEPLYLWCRMRHPSRFKIGERECLGAEQITLCLPTTNAGVMLGPVIDRAGSFRQIITGTAELDAFAIFDGFECWGDLVAFWRSTHRNQAQFDGWHIRWLPLPELGL